MFTYLGVYVQSEVGLNLPAQGLDDSGLQHATEKATVRLEKDHR